MQAETFKHFKYEIALGVAIPMPKPELNYYPKKQYSVQQFLHALCKEHVGSLGKRGGKWEFGPDAPHEARLSSREDITQVFDFAEKMGIIEPETTPPSQPDENGEVFIPYRLSKAYWSRFDSFAL